MLAEHIPIPDLVIYLRAKLETLKKFCRLDPRPRTETVVSDWWREIQV